MAYNKRGSKVKLMYDVVIIGAGVTGTATARELAKYNLSICVLEKDEDVCSGTSKANSAIVHAGYDAKVGSLKAKMNIRGAEIIKQLSSELNFGYWQNGSMVLCFQEEGKSGIEDLYKRGIENGVKELRILTGDEARELEPNLTDEVCYALLAPTAAICDPFGMNIAFFENARDNGVEFKFNYKVNKVEKKNDYYLINNEIETKTIVNAAGLFADEIHNQVCDNKLHITPRRGEYKLLDKQKPFVTHTIFQLPTKLGKGVLVAPTIHGNMLVGPSATDTDNKEDLATTAISLDEITEKAKLSVKNIPFNTVITSFAGLRAHEDNNEFVVQESIDGFFDAAGIESPGLTSAPAIGEYLCELIINKLKPSKNERFISLRKDIPHLAMYSFDERAKLIQENPLYGNIVCRCCDVSEGEIIDAIKHGAISLDGIKRRTGAMMGRCQGGFCTPKILEIMARELNIPLESIKKNSGNSYVVVGHVEED